MSNRITHLRNTYLGWVQREKVRRANARSRRIAMRKARATYKADPTKANLRAYKHAKRMYALRQRTLTRTREKTRAARKAYLGARHRPLRLRAYDQAVRLRDLDIREQGGNNRGYWVSKIIKAAGGTGPEPWCGDAMFYVYKLAGSKSVSRNWALVAAFSWIAGVRKTNNPRTGNLVRFIFDHIGMFVHWCDKYGNRVPRWKATHVKTLEGNTGSTGAVSDSTDGKDGFYEKIRPLAQVQDFLDVRR